MSASKSQPLSRFSDLWQGLAWPLVSALLPTILGVASVAGLILTVPSGAAIFVCYLVPIAIAAGFRLWRHASVFRLERASWHFHCLHAQNVTVRYDPRAHSRSQAMTVLHRTDQEITELNRRIGHMPRAGVTLFLFASKAQVSALRGRDQVGFALAPGTVVVGEWAYLHETIRHELAHLFLQPWHTPLLAEGFAVWWQETRGGLPIDEAAIPPLRRQELCLANMLNSKFFHDLTREYDCYTLAGSLTGFLIRRLGLAGYLKFYREAARRGVRKALRQHLGLTLEQVEARWRVELSMTKLLWQRRGLLAEL
jgi:hypothetical protein